MVALRSRPGFAQTRLISSMATSPVLAAVVGLAPCWASAGKAQPARASKAAAARNLRIMVRALQLLGQRNASLVQGHTAASRRGTGLGDETRSSSRQVRTPVQPVHREAVQDQGSWRRQLPSPK